MKKLFSNIIIILFYALVFVPVWLMFINEAKSGKPPVMMFLWMSISVLSVSCIVIDVISKWVDRVMEIKS